MTPVPLHIVALTCITLLAVGYLVVALAWMLPATRAKVAEVWPILLTETLYVGAAVAALWVGGWVYLVAATLFAARIGYEAVRVAYAAPALPALAAGLAVGGVALAAMSAAPVSRVVILAAVLLIGAVVLLRRYPSRSLRLLAFPVLPLLVFLSFGAHPFGATPLLTALLLVETFDSYALLGGKLFGKRLAFPRLSPKKTVEGLATGAAMLVLTAAVVGPLVLGVPLLLSIGAALLAGALAVAGDLAASATKRRAGVKDYPRILPHQGGLLDITDAWIAAGAGFALIAALW